MKNREPEPSHNDRRKFLTVTASVAAATMIGNAEAQEQDTAGKGHLSGNTTSKVANELCVFTKPFNSLSFDELADKIAAMGFDGIEAPIRPGGHIEPEDVTEKLPLLNASLEKAGLKITVLTSDINSASTPLSRSVLETAAELGIKRFRMQYFRYDRKAEVLKQIDGWRKEFDGLAEFCRKTNIQALYQNHAGAHYMGSVLWDLQRVLQDIDPKQIGVAYDIRHAVAEGGLSWETTWRMIQRHVEAIYVKDFQWQGDKVLNVPLGEGRVPKSFFDMIRKAQFEGPISLHEEYLDHKKPELVPDHLAAIKKDLATLNTLMAK